MHKKIIAILFALALFLFGSAISVNAASNQAEVVFKNGDTKYYTDFREAWDVANDNLDSTIIMLSNWNLEGDDLWAGTWLIDHADFTLDLNGYTIDGDGSRMITIDSGIFTKGYKPTILTIIDSSPNQTGTLTNGGAEYGGAIYVEGMLNFNGGTIKNCVGTGIGEGGAIYVSDKTMSGLYILQSPGTVVIDGGKIENCTSNGNGGGLALGAGAKGYLKSGSISNCTCRSNGGGVFIGNGTNLTMEEGFTISNCSSQLQGGGICLYASSVFTMNGGNITGCSSNKGGGIFVFGSTSAVSGRYLDYAKAFLYGGTISNNTCIESGGGVGTYGAISSNPSHVTVGKSLVIYDNYKDGKQNNLYLDTSSADSHSVYFQVSDNNMSGKIGITCEEQRKISEVDSYRNLDHFVSDNANWSIKYEIGNQCYYLVNKVPDARLISAESQDANSWTEYDYDHKIATVYFPRPFKDVEIIDVVWTGNEVTLRDGTWVGKYTESPLSVSFYNCYGVKDTMQYFTITNTLGQEQDWKIVIKEADKHTLYLCNATEASHEMDHEYNGNRYYEVYPNETITLVADPAPEGMMFDSWITSRGVYLELTDEQAKSSRLTINMPESENNKVGFKATYKDFKTMNDDQPKFSLDIISFLLGMGLVAIIGVIVLVICKKQKK